MTRTQQFEVLDWLRAGHAWSVQPDVVETHAALIFLVGDRAYKVKKAIDLGYLDFSTLEQRRRALERELRLNRRTAPNLYLSVRPICLGADGDLSLSHDGEVVEWLLEMRRFPGDALLSTVADRGVLDGDAIARLAARIAAFHEQEPVRRGYDWTTAVARIALENTQDLRSQRDLLGKTLTDAVVEQRERLHRACTSELAAQAGDVRHCHGDLHLRNVFLDHGEPTLFDCIEFNDFYALIPPLYDLAFLLMDLEARRLPQLANLALNGWWLARDPARWNDLMRSLRLLPLYLSLRAEISAKTMARVSATLQRACDYLSLAQNFRFGSPRLTAIGGLSGTGKSSLGRAIAFDIGVRPGAVHLRSDQIRKRLEGVGETERLPPSAYTATASDRVYDRMFALAALALAAGHSVILDAVFAREAERDQAEKIAKDAGADFAGLWLEAPTETLAHRLDMRRGDASDADAHVLRKQLGYDLGNITWTKIDAGHSGDQVSRVVRRHLSLSEVSR